MLASRRYVTVSSMAALNIVLMVGFDGKLVFARRLAATHTCNSETW